jgi:hypothetical protein
MLETGGVVGHAVGVAREVLSQVAVAVDPLVIARKPTQSRRRARRGDRALCTRETAGVLSEKFSMVT